MDDTIFNHSLSLLIHRQSGLFVFVAAAVVSRVETT